MIENIGSPQGSEWMQSTNNFNNKYTQSKWIVASDSVGRHHVEYKQKRIVAALETN